MKLKTLLFSLLFSASLLAQQTNESVDIGGTQRTYVQYLPTAFDSNTESLPVVFCLHGIGDVATNIANIGFNQIADTARFIAIYPQGVVNGFGQTSWNNGTLLGSTAEDLNFFNEMMDDAILNLNADPTRVYVSGFSMGGIMSHHLACNLNSRVAAIGSMSGTMSTTDLNNCVPSYVTPMIHFHGTADATVPYDAGALPSLSLAPQTIDFWRTAHGCASTSDSTQITDSASDGYTVDRFIYQSCTPNASVEFWRINGGDHEYFYQPLNDFTESIEIWRFFRQWSHSNPAAAAISELEKGNFIVYPNPSNGEITIEVNEEAAIQIFDILGNEVLSIKVFSGENTVDISNLAPGTYIVQNDSSSKRINIK